jgi:hypothetical protein
MAWLIKPILKVQLSNKSNEKFLDAKCEQAGNIH